MMIVDDHVDTSELTAQLVELRGHRARVFFDGTTALAGAAAFDPHVVVVDLQLPDMDGMELVRALRSTLRTARIVVVTGHAKEGVKETAMEAGANAYLTKPVAYQLLIALLEAE